MQTRSRSKTSLGTPSKAKAATEDSACAAGIPPVQVDTLQDYKDAQAAGRRRLKEINGKKRIDLASVAGVSLSLEKAMKLRGGPYFIPMREKKAMKTKPGQVLAKCPACHDLLGPFDPHPKTNNGKPAIIFKDTYATTAVDKVVSPDYWSRNWQHSWFRTTLWKHWVTKHKGQHLPCFVSMDQFKQDTKGGDPNRFMWDHPIP